MLEDLVLYQKTYDLILWLFPIINKFPQKQRFVLAQQIENELIETVKDIIQANHERSKRELLQRISLHLEISRILIRLAKDFGFMSIRQYEHAAEKLNEIGKILAGLLKRFS